LSLPWVRVRVRVNRVRVKVRVRVRVRARVRVWWLPPDTSLDPSSIHITFDERIKVRVNKTQETDVIELDPQR